MKTTDGETRSRRPFAAFNAKNVRRVPKHPDYSAMLEQMRADLGVSEPAKGRSLPPEMFDSLYAGPTR